MGPEFADIKMPQDCVKKCDEKFGVTPPQERAFVEMKAEYAREVADADQSGFYEDHYKADEATAPKDNSSCKVLCQRFAMSSMGAEFAGITSPTECVSKCDAVFPATSQ